VEDLRGELMIDSQSSYAFFLKAPLAEATSMKKGLTQTKYKAGETRGLTCTLPSSILEPESLTFILLSAGATCCCTLEE